MKYKRDDIIILGLLLPVILQAAVIVGITFYGFALSLIKHFL